MGRLAILKSREYLGKYGSSGFKKECSYILQIAGLSMRGGSSLSCLGGCVGPFLEKWHEMPVFNSFLNRGRFEHIFQFLVPSIPI